MIVKYIIGAAQNSIIKYPNHGILSDTPYLHMSRGHKS